MLTSCLIAIVLGFSGQTSQVVEVNDDDGLRRGVAEARAGTTILIAPGTYRGGISASGLEGTPERPIVIRGANPARPPVLQGGTSAFQFSSIAHLELRDLVLSGATGNGLNIDDGGRLDHPSRHVVLSGLVVRDVGPKGNRDGIKLSGVADFRVEGCTIERWGDRGSGIDMVGCLRGEIVDCAFRHGDDVGDHGVQAKGGSRSIVVGRCRFEHAGTRAVNLGGSTGLAYFRPKPEGYEAKDVTVEDCLFIGSQAPIAFVGADGSVVRHNTIFRPTRWVFRILQETREPGFVPCRAGRFEDNLVVFRSDEMTVPINVGDATAPDTFAIARNAWYCLDAPARSRPRLPIAETEGRHGVAPSFQDAERGDLRRKPNDPTLPAGDRPAKASERRPS